MINFKGRELQELLDNFFILTDLKTCVFDLDYNEVASSPVKVSDFCRYLRQNPSFDHACRACDINAVRKCRRTREGFFYRCHLGLTEYVAPLFYNEAIVGFMLAGHGADGSPEERELVFQCLSKYNFDQATCMQLYDSMSHYAPERLVAAGKIIEACASHIYHKRMLEVRQLDTMQQIEKYIMDNLGWDLSVEHLCEQFGLSRGDLYRMFQNSFGSSVADYIRNKRLARAETLIRTTSSRISEIAPMVGFYDYNYFSKVFRSVYGMSPREYRKAAAEGRLPETAKP